MGLPYDKSDRHTDLYVPVKNGARSGVSGYALVQLVAVLGPPEHEIQPSDAYGAMFQRLLGQFKHNEIQPSYAFEAMKPCFKAFWGSFSDLARGQVTKGLSYLVPLGWLSTREE
eukprot:741512-Prorocentrum_minimum.AAC.2